MRSIAILPLALAILPGHLAGQGASIRYRVTDLGSLGQGNGFIVWDINSSGDLAGEQVPDGDVPQPVYVHPATKAGPISGGPINLPNGVAYGVNERGEAAGGFVPMVGAALHAYVFREGEAADIHAQMSLGGDYSVATGINDEGDIVGAATAGPGPSTDSRHAVVYENGQLVDLHANGRLGSRWSEALDINNARDVAGALESADAGCPHAFLLGAGSSTLTDFHGLLPGGGCSSYAWGINDRGDVVGSADSLRGPPYAFLYAGGRVFDLNNLIPANSGWVLAAAHGISNDGRIVGYGSYLGAPRSFLLTPAEGDGHPPGILTVAELLASPAEYAGMRLTVTGRVRIAVRRSLLPCPEDKPDCDTILGVDLLLDDAGGGSASLAVYQGGDSFPCFHDAQGNYGCGDFQQGIVVTLEGAFVKGERPELVVGGSAEGGGSSPPRVVTYTDFYYFDVGRPATNRRSR